jgi:hypothetical protein
MHDWSSSGVPHPNSPAGQHYDSELAGIPHPNSPAGQHAVSAPKLMLKQRFIEVLKLVPNHLAPELAGQFRAMLTPLSLGIMAGTFALLAVSQGFVIGEVIDVIVFVGGTIFVGKAMFTAAEEIFACLKITVKAKTEADLDKAAKHLAEAIAILGVVVFFAVIGGLGQKSGGAGGAEEGGSAGSASKVNGEVGAAKAELAAKAAEEGAKAEAAAKAAEEAAKAKEAEAAAARTARQILSKAAQEEPKVTSELQGLADQNGGKLVGLKDRLKTESSLTRKLISNSKHMSLEEAAANNRDTLRYTMVFDEESYASNVNRTMSELEAQGYKRVAVKSTWEPDDPYRGVNTVFQSPAGQNIEVQFHTPDSYYVKSEVNHRLYEQFRLDSTPYPQQVVLKNQMIQNSASVRTPPGVDRIQGAGALQ